MIKPRDALWIVALAALAVGARNFEPGLSGDAPIYAYVAKNIARTGDLFSLQSGLPEFPHFAEHPHLGFWLLAIVFKILPIDDWSARIPGHLFYVATLLLLYRYIRRVADDRTATLGILMMWALDRFSMYFNTAYLDPELLFFGTASFVLLDIALTSGRKIIAVASGVSFALAAMVKGLAVVGFIPVCGLIAIVHWRRATAPREVVARIAMALGGMLGTLALYALAIRASSDPTFLAHYWQRQYEMRFRRVWTLRGGLAWEGWRYLLSDSHYLIVLVPLALRTRDFRRVLIPATLLITFTTLYVGAGLARYQYWLTVLPWIAWLAAEGIAPLIPTAPERLRIISVVIALAAVMLLQYLPIRTHGDAPPEEVAAIRELAKTNQPIVMVVGRGQLDFIRAGAFPWYTDLPVRYLKSPSVNELRGLSSKELAFFPDDSKALFTEARFCLRQKFTRSELWCRCDSESHP